ncbi:MAG: iron-containing alcohol dehydrogenase [Candidatus Kapabacteria bacterium]|nr:iron-containing alcohol dehydrogenase [Ignavibacteriota bacterium]MCW5885306.1 iron-containing alcohol dehydrogenase [Candidatus Kapabacteria bacterium]
MEYFKFHNPTKVIFGKGTIVKIGEEIKESGINRVLLLYGGGSIMSNGVYNQVVSSLKSFGVEFVEFGGVQPNPVLEHARLAIEVMKQDNLQAVLAVGGGSVIDEAKSIAAGYFVDDVWNIFEKTESVEKALPLFTVLTLSATGTEMNSFAVLSNPAEYKKWAFGSPYSYPKVSIIDPEVQTTLPWRQTINGGVDSLSHIMELYFAGDDAETTLSINEALMRTIIKSMDELLIDERNYQARAELAWSASLALSGITGVSMNGGEWAVHRIEHAISVMFPEVAHAEGLAVLFPAWIKYVNSNSPKRFERWAKNVFNENTVEEGIEALLNTLKKWKAPTSLAEINVDKSYIPRLAEIAMKQGTLGNIKKIEYDDVVKILEIAL